MAGGSTSALSLSGPAQASLALRPVGSLSRPKATFVARLQPSELPSQAARQLQDPIDNFPGGTLAPQTHRGRAEALCLVLGRPVEVARVQASALQA